MANLMMAGNPREQPRDLIPYFGYDNLMRPLGRVEIAGMDVLGDLGIISAEDYRLLTPEVRENVLVISTTEVDRVEREITKHDVRAWTMLAKERLPEPLHRWVHVPYTSYDGLDTARIYMFLGAYHFVIVPKLKRTVRLLADMADRFSGQVQIGRTHGQHALPITVGFWLSTLLSRILYNWEEVDSKAEALVAKISGAVGAYNAQVALGIEEKCGRKSFETRVLAKLGLEPARISTQILPPEPLAYFLHSMLMLTGAFAQLGRDCRQLMRTEIAEVAEEFEQGQSGSSTMAHKRNPINFEKIEGTHLKTVAEYLKVLLTLISEHQRDLVNSTVMRDFPVIPINLTVQLDTLLRENKQKVPFLQRITISPAMCERNFGLKRNVVLAEPLYIALQMAGYKGDAHKLINEQAVPRAEAENRMLVDVLRSMSEQDSELAASFDQMPKDLIEQFRFPEKYIGKAVEKTREIVAIANEQVA